MFKLNYMTRLWLASWLPVLGAAICGFLVIKEMKHDKDHLAELNNQIVELKKQLHQA